MAISGNFTVSARNCLTFTFNYIVMQMRKVNCEKGYYLEIRNYLEIKNYLGIRNYLRITLSQDKKLSRTQKHSAE